MKLVLAGDLILGNLALGKISVSIVSWCSASCGKPFAALLLPPFETLPWEVVSKHANASHSQHHMQFSRQGILLAAPCFMFVLKMRLKRQMLFAPQ